MATEEELIEYLAQILRNIKQLEILMTEYDQETTRQRRHRYKT